MEVKRKGTRSRRLSDDWQSLVSSFPHRPELQQESIVALPLRLIDFIEQFAPRLLAPEDIQFEKQLRRVVGSGRWRNSGFALQCSGHPGEALRECGNTRDPELNWVNGELLKKHRNQLHKNGWSEGKIQFLQGKNAEFALRMWQLSKGYLGWLVTEPLFRMELSAFLYTNREWIEQEGRFPEIRKRLLGEQVSPACSSSVAGAQEALASVFLQRWSLDTLLTPDLPSPLQPQANSRCLYDLGAMSSGGLVVLLPWYMLHDQSITLREIMAVNSDGNSLEHMTEWLKLERGRDRWGYVRYAMMFDLYVFWHLALQVRYADRLAGHIGELEKAFGVYFDESRESLSGLDRGKDVVHKIRLRLAKRLRQCDLAIRLIAKSTERLDARIGRPQSGRLPS